MTAEIAVIGGSGFYRFLDEAVTVTPDTPYGEPSGPITVGAVGGRRVAFLPRHGPDHHLPPHRINARANLWALARLGVRRVVGPCAVGSLRADVHPGELMVLDQLVDRTWGRADTYLDGPERPGGDAANSGTASPVVEHVSFADPYCPELSAVLAETGLVAHRRGTVVVVQGPRFSTRAESRWYRDAGWDVINMTQYPEAYLARELGLCYAGLALVTDYDTGVDNVGVPVTMEAVLAVLAANVEQTRTLLASAIPAIPDRSGCSCASLGAIGLHRVATEADLF